MTYAVALLPLLASILIGAGDIISALTKSTRHYSSCVKTGFTQFDRISISANALFKLNAKAKQLRTQYNRAQLQLLAAMATGDPVKIGLCEARLAKIELARAALATQQNLFIQQIHLLEGELMIRGRFISGFQAIDPGDLSLVGDNPTEMAPAYRFKNDDRRSMTTRIHYKIFKNSTECGFSLEKRGSVYRATLSQIRECPNDRV